MCEDFETGGEEEYGRYGSSMADTGENQILNIMWI